MGDRLKPIDGLRGVAILSVVVFHVFTRWPDHVPYGHHYEMIGLYGWLGVRLFFIISGFVILMTLDKCASFSSFIWRRWLRLFPAMLVCSLLIYATGALLVDRPFGPPRLRDLLPGLLFIDSRWMQVAGLPIHDLEGTFWSLFAEVEFYIFFGALYFWRGRGVAIWGLAGCFVAWWIMRLTHILILRKIATGLALEWYGWFLCGALFFDWRRTGDPRRLWLALAVGVASSAGIILSTLPDWYPAIWGLGMVALFWSALTLPFLQTILSSRPIQFVGAISYPFYLLHEQAIIAMISQLGKWRPAIPGLLLPLLPLALLMALAWLVAHYAEPFLRERIRRLKRPA